MDLLVWQVFWIAVVTYLATGLGALASLQVGTNTVPMIPALEGRR